MEIVWGDMAMDKRAVQADAAGLVEDWRWLVPEDAEVMLPTACGDLFLRLPDGSIAFLKTFNVVWE